MVWKLREIPTSSENQVVTTFSKKSTARELVASVEHLIGLPEVYVHLNKVLNNPDHILDDVTQVVSLDPAICASVLKVVNSSYYALPNPVGNISMAVNMIGEQALSQMVLTTSVANSMDALVDQNFDIRGFWRHSIRCGITARLLAKYQSESDAELLFLIGLLHDLGKLVIYKQAYAQHEKITSRGSNNGESCHMVEKELLGYDHEEVGALLVESWNLPPEIAEIIRYHHQPDLATHFKKEAKLIKMADQMAHYVEWKKDSGKIDLEALPIYVFEYLIDMEIQIDELVELLNEVKEQSQAIENVICS